VEFDGMSEFHMLRQPATAAHVGDGILELIQRGFLERILLSQNVDRKIDLKALGGMGYTFVLDQFVPHLTGKGVTEEQIRTLIYENPKRVLTFAAPGKQRK
jgi:predicted metal-dependent phosphotriesterase family hydrolase